MIILNLAPVNIESEIISIADFAICNIHFYDSKTIAYIGIFAIHVDVVHGLVASGRSCIIIRKISYFKVADIHQVNISIAIEDNKPFASLVVADMLDVTIT